MPQKITSQHSLQEILIEHLLSKGYPEESFKVDWRQNDLEFSLAIIYPVNQKVMAVFDFLISKPNPIIVSSRPLREIIQKYQLLVSDPKIPLYIVGALEGDTKFSVKKILYQTKDSNYPHFITVQDLLDYDTLKKNVFNTTNMNNDFSKITDEELEGIIRLHENPDVSGSRFQRAMTELDLRYKKRGYKPGIHFEVGGNMNIDGSSILLGDNNQMTAKVQGDFSGRNSNIEQKKSNNKSWFSMENPLVYVVVFIILGAIVYFLSKYKLPFQFGSSIGN